MPSFGKNSSAIGCQLKIQPGFFCKTAYEEIAKEDEKVNQFLLPLPTLNSLF